MLRKKFLLALSTSLVCSESLLAKEDKTYTLGKVSTAGQKDRTDYSGQVNLGYSGLTAPKSWQDEEVKKYTGSRTVISNKALTQQANQSIEEALQNVPGLQVRNATGVGAMPTIQVRGFGAGGSGHSNATLMLVNGIPVYMAPYSHIELDIFPVTFQAIDRIDVIKGGGSVQYGPNTYGGIVNIITKPIPKRWENQAAERMTFWAKARNAGFANTNTGDSSFLKSLGNNLLYNTYVRSGGMINKHFGVQAQANWVMGQGFRDNTPTNIQNYWLDGVYDINENNGIKAYYQYYKFNIAQPGSLSEQDYKINRFANLRPFNAKGGRSQRFGIVYENRFGDLDKVGGTFTFTYYGQFMTRDFQVSSSYNSANMVTCYTEASCVAQGLPSGYNLAVPYTFTNYNGYAEIENPVRSINNAFEPKVNLVVNTGKVKQTFIVGLRFMTTTFLQRQYMNTNICPTETQHGVSGFFCKNGQNVMSGWQPHKKHGFYWNWADWRNNYTAVYLSDRIETWDGRFFIVPGLRYAFVQYNNENPSNWEPISDNWPSNVPKPDRAAVSKQESAQALKKIKHMNNWLPSLNIGFIPVQGDHTLLTYFNYQRSFVPPQLDVLSFGGAEYFTQHFDSVEVGARYTYKDKFSFNADFFRIWARNFATGQYSVYTSGPYAGSVRPVNGYSQGVELEMYYRPIKGLQFHAAFNYIDTRVTSHETLTDLNGDSFPGKTSYNKHFPFVSPYQFILDARYTYAKTTFGTSSYFYSRAYSGISNSAAGGYYGTQYYSGGNNYQSVFNSGYQCAQWCMTQHEGLLPWYWVWNVEVSQVFWESGRHKIVGSLQVNNLLNMKYYFTGIGSSPAGLQPGPGRSVTAYLNYTF
ncbi:TonB-dependent receptor family protein [Helicobacter bizzozeronii]|uniref:TonB-dependent receptor family protein n=1 Tax=Helicobacter bizzozeronii TaxID=56877 RepID=UPI000CEE9C98|nr:TonB-dependent receptor family protein [Helicobacter bizzozeronii]